MTHTPPRAFTGPEQVSDALQGSHYFADAQLSTTVYLAQQLKRPVFLEGVPGGGKTSLAEAIAVATGRELIRLQCFAGMDAADALYDWDFASQVLHLRSLQRTEQNPAEGESVYSQRFLEARPLLKALYNDHSVLLIDEVDRADEEFEAVLLEFLADYAITVPHFGTIRAANTPLVFLTSNRTRDVHPALKRRCLYHYLGHPPSERELQILLDRWPDAGLVFATDIIRYVNNLRSLDLIHPPGLAETLDFAMALRELGAVDFTSQNIGAASAALVKHPEDTAKVLVVARDSTSGPGSTGIETHE